MALNKLSACPPTPRNAAFFTQPFILLMHLTRRLLSAAKPLISIEQSLFEKRAVYEAGIRRKEYVFPNRISHFEAYKPNSSTSGSTNPHFWAVTGPRKSDFLSIVAGKYVPEPATGRKYSILPHERIQFLNFRESSGLDKVHLSARYESFSSKADHELTDDVNSVRNYVTGANNYNSKTSASVSDELTNMLLEMFNLTHLAKKWINSLSNGQMRRARIARSLINKPDMLVIDDPFLGLDPEATELVCASLAKVANELHTSVILGLRVQDDVPDWIGHMAFVNDDGLALAGARDKVEENLDKFVKLQTVIHEKNERDHAHQWRQIDQSVLQNEKCHVQFQNASVVYKGLPVLQNFNWCIPRGSRWRILGNNGTGKTTILSLITADHPQLWKSVLSIDGVLRKSGSGANFFDVNNAIGMSSPELHALVPTSKTMMEIILNGLVKDVGNSNFLYKPKEPIELPKSMERFQDRLSIYGDVPFGELSVTDQKLALFLRAVIKNPSLLILDEAFSCMDDEDVMVQCHRFIEQELQDCTVLTIGHIDWEVAPHDYVLKLTGDVHRSYQIWAKKS